MVQVCVYRSTQGGQSSTVEVFVLIQLRRYIKNG